MRGLARCMRLLCISLAFAAPAGAEEGKPGKEASGQKQKPGAKKPAPAPAEPSPETPGEPAAGGKAEAAEGPEPEFRSAKGQEAFADGKQFFEVESYKEALEAMKKAKEQAKAAPDKSAVDRWIKACQGGSTLQSYKKMVGTASGRQVLFAALTTREAYKDTPIVPRYDLFVDEMWSKTLHVLETFDSPSLRFTEKYGKHFIVDKKLVYHGTGCLQWSSTKEPVSQLKLADAPRRWTSYHSVVFWIRSDRPVDFQLLALSPGKAEEQSAMECSVSSPASVNWRLVEVPLDNFKKHGQGTFAAVDLFMIQIDSKASYKFYIDEVALVRKDGAEAAADTKDDQKKKKKATTSAGKAKQTERKKS
jgi:hypothetical protein